jgi:hypothetical protein
MLKEMYKTGYSWCFKYGKGAILVLLVYLLLEIAKKLINKYFGIDVNSVFIPGYFSFYGIIVFFLALFIEAWVGLEFLNYIYRGENEKKYDFIVFNKVNAYILPAFIGSLILNLIMLVPMFSIVMVSEMANLYKGVVGVLWLILLLVIFLLFVLPFAIWLSLRLSFYLEVIIVNSIKDPILALKESFKITKGKVWSIIRILILPIFLALIIVIFLSKIVQEMGCSSCEFIGFASAIVKPLLLAVSFALYLEFKKDSVKESNPEEQIKK